MLAYDDQSADYRPIAAPAYLDCRVRVRPPHGASNGAGYRMEQSSANPKLRAAFEELLGYLNFSSGSPDVQFLRNLNLLFQHVESQSDSGPAWLAAREMLSGRLSELKSAGGPFQESEQAEQIIRLLWERFFPAYREFHADLLFHQTDEALWRPYFIGRAAEALLRQGGPWDEDERIVPAAIAELNDYIGHRPVAVLRNEQRHEPYDHEWVRPVPLYIREAGVAIGRYDRLIEHALDILRQTEPGTLFQAHFDLALLEELAFDPRAYDFDHPVNKRPNYHFGQWDPHHLDNDGRYRRFVVQQMLLDSLLSRVEEASENTRAELEWEAAAVLAGTILMAAGTSGSGPDTYDSTTTLAKLLPRIAAYRDSFYEGLLKRAQGPHGDRLRTEAVEGRQPFAGARQHLNHALARRRAEQVQRVQLAIIFAKLGYTDAALHQAAHCAGRVRPHCVRDSVPVDQRRAARATGAFAGSGHLATAGPRAHPPWDPMRSAGRSLERAGLPGAVQPVPVAGEQRPRSSD